MHVVLCNCSPAESLSLARTLVTERLAACVNVISSVTSVYSWEGALQEEAEHTLLIKTTSARLDALMKRLKAIHSYDVPEILALPVVKADSDYAKWVEQNCLSGEST